MSDFFWLTERDADLVADQSTRDNCEDLLESGCPFPTLEAARKAVDDGHRKEHEELGEFFRNDKTDEPYVPLVWEEQRGIWYGHDAEWLFCAAIRHYVWNGSPAGSPDAGWFQDEGEED